MAVITCVEDLKDRHKKRVPRMFYDYAESGSWTESTYRRNEQAPWRGAPRGSADIPG